jgi:uncharacterized protein (DUF58 family)
MYPTARMIFVALAGVPLTVIAALVSPPFWLVGTVWIVFCAGLFLLDAMVAAAPSACTLFFHAAEALGVGRPAQARIEVQFAARPPSQVQFAIDTNARVRAEPHRIGSTVESSVAQAQIMLRPIRRGEGAVERIWTRWRGPLGLCWRQLLHTERRAFAILPDIAAVKEQAVRLFQREAGQTGLRAQLRTGEGAEFNALKEFQSGMDRRTIDWKQSARHSRLLAREFQAEENLHIVFALDTGRLMCEPLAGLPRIDRAVQALLLLAFVALRLGDRVGIFAFDERPVMDSGAIAGANAFPVLQRVAAKLDYSTAETNFTLGLTQLSAGTLHRSVVIVFTDFADTVGAELMIENVRQLLARHVVLFVAFRDEELETMRRAEPKEPADVSRAVLADTMLREREAVIMQLRRLGVDVIDAPVERIGMRLVETYLAVKHGRAGV